MADETLGELVAALRRRSVDASGAPPVSASRPRTTTTSSRCSRRTPARSGCPGPAPRPCGGSPSRWRRDDGSAPWCGGPVRPSSVLLHGGGQNAHTWDTVALALGRPLVAIDLPGHGHSDWPGDDERARSPGHGRGRGRGHRPPGPVGPAGGGDVPRRGDVHRPGPGPSRAWSPSWLSSTSPRGSPGRRARTSPPFWPARSRFASFDEILERTIQFNPTRSESSLRRGVLHNSVQREDGTWTWRHQLGRPAGSSGHARRLGRLRPAVGRARSHRRPRAPGPGRALPGGGRRRRGRVPPPPTRRPRDHGRRGRPQHPGRPAPRAGRASSTST